jgi:hypothetical protein
LLTASVVAANNGNNRRVAQPFDPAGITNTVGATSFAHFAKGGYHERIGNGVCAERTKVASAASPPALANNAGTGHPRFRIGKENAEKLGHPPAHATRIGVDMSFQPGSKEYNNHYQRYTGD